jgi:predicted anti-sigma-YlaC factor YlaD
MAERLMVRCKEASSILATSEWPPTRGHRLAVRFHLAICPDCRAFRRQLDALAALARESAAGFEQEYTPDTQTRIVGELTRALR